MGSPSTVEVWQVVNESEMDHCHILEHAERGMMGELMLEFEP